MQGYRYRNVEAALDRFFTLETILGKPGAFPLAPDEVKPTARQSADSDILIEWIDLRRAVMYLGVFEQAVLFTEYTMPKLALEGPKFGQNKLEELRKRCGIQMNGDEYVAIAKRGTQHVRAILESWGWLRPSRSKRDDSSFSFGGTHRKRSLG